jgi:hypothetical protein
MRASKDSRDMQRRPAAVTHSFDLKRVFREAGRRANQSAPRKARQAHSASWAGRVHVDRVLKRVPTASVASE